MVRRLRLSSCRGTGCHPDDPVSKGSQAPAIGCNSQQPTRDGESERVVCINVGAASVMDRHDERAWVATGLCSGGSLANFGGGQDRHCWVRLAF